MTREQGVRLLLDHPYKVGHLLGFDRLTELHNGWIRDMVSGKEDKTLQAHRGSYKTTCVSLALAITMALMPRKRVLFMRKTDSDTKEVLAQVRKIIESEQMQYISSCIYGVPVSLTTSTANELSTNLSLDIKGTSQLVGMGLGSSITGKHFDAIYTDDIVNVSDRTSRAERERTKLMYQELRNIINRGGRIYNTGTPWHIDDAFTIMSPAERHDCYTTGLISKEELDVIRDGMAPALFAANYELRHIASDDVIFTRPQTGADPAMVEQGEAHIDAGYHGEDYTAFTIARRVDGVIYVYGKMWRHHVDDVMDEIIKDRKRFNAGMIACEDNADKGYLARDLRKRGERVFEYHETANKYLKIVTHLKAEWSNIRFVEGTDKAYINQICDYTEDAAHDDAPDSLASIIRRLQRRGKDGKVMRHAPGMLTGKEVKGGWDG